MKNENKYLTSKDCSDFLSDEMKKELIGPSDGLFNRSQWKKKKDGVEEVGTPSLSFFPSDPNFHKQEVLINSPKYNYIAGILYPKETTYEETVDENFESEDEIVSEVEESASEKNSDSNDEQNGNSENNFDHDTPDNEDPIDLTNELKPSAMGLSVCMEIPQNLIVSIKNVGQYYKVGKKEIVPKEPRIVAFYISKFNDKKKTSYKWISKNFSLENSNRNTCENFVAEVFNIKPNTIKNTVDYFDKFFEQRVGWNEKISSANDSIKNEFDNYKKEDLEKEIKKIIELQIKNEPTQQIKYEGYFRKNLNLDIEFRKDEILSGKTKKFFDDNNEEIGLSIYVVNRNISKNKYKYLTFHLVNDNEVDEKTLIKDCFFQCQFELREKNFNPIFKEYQEKGTQYMDDEEKSLHLLHRNYKSYAVGHGCAASWELKDNKCTKVFSEIFPTHEVKPIRPKQFDDLDLDMIIFSEDINFALTELNKLLNKYNSWLEKESLKTSSIDVEFQEISKLNVGKAKHVSERIKEGLDILEKNNNVQEAFCLMNKAMAHQQFHYTLSTEKNFKFDGDLKNINYSKEIQNIKIGDKILKKGKWYPFQIIFIILNIKSFIDPLSDDRKIMDLIWFPTGGGKTEAYLGLSAFVIFLRKLIDPNKTGNAVIMRYTLRLLTTQQFLRASTLICACEKLRCENEDKLGKNEIGIGLWIGGEATPNTEDQAKKILDSLHNQYSNLENKFLVINCPWCGADMGPDATNYISGFIPGYRKEKKIFVFSCENEKCNFSHKNNKNLPIDVIDERIYKKSPDLIIGTIDKFATLPWRSEAIDCFTSNENKNSTDLIIQDELHLISGPLGSVSGMYEICIKALTEKKIDNKVISAKIVGSTATISRAETQISSLYGTKCSIFPSQTNQLEDSFFSYEKKDDDGRKYVGIFCQSSTSPQITLSKVIASLLVNTKIFSIESKNNYKIFDPYWTQVIYFNSIRELMSGASLVYDDVDGEKNALYVKKGIDVDMVGHKNYYRFLGPRQIAELTSRQDSSEIPKILKRMFVSKSNEKTYPYDICLATNMIQVGIDIPRLSLMLINGQPKTTSEYIQASSRVGRDQNSPGLVFNILSPFKPRDRSHYEHFKSYHQSLYNFVEPTSVTPHSDSVRKRCLHAVVITLCRLWDNKLRNDPTESPDIKIKKKVTDYIIDYVKKADPKHPEEIEKTIKEINTIFNRWKEIQPTKYGSMKLDQSLDGSLMYPSGTEKKIEGDQFETPTSMRNVDRECSAKIRRTIGGHHEI